MLNSAILELERFQYMHETIKVNFHSNFLVSHTWDHRVLPHKPHSAITMIPVTDLHLPSKIEPAFSEVWWPAIDYRMKVSQFLARGLWWEDTCLKHSNRRYISFMVIPPMIALTRIVNTSLNWISLNQQESQMTVAILIRLWLSP